MYIYYCANITLSLREGGEGVGQKITEDYGGGPEGPQKRIT